MNKDSPDEAGDRRRRAFADIFVRYGGGSHIVQRIAACKAWNLISWVLIALGVAGWVVFLTWKAPYTP